MTSTSAESATEIDDDRVRVTRWTFMESGAATGEHQHEYDYVVVPVTGGSFEVISSDGAVRTMTQLSGAPYLGSAGTRHDVASVSDEPVTFVEIELKR